MTGRLGGSIASPALRAGAFPERIDRSMRPAEPLPAHHAIARDRARAGGRLVAGGISLNAGLAIVKFSGGILGHSYALIADGIESLLDVLSSLLVWAGFRVAERPPDAEHPFGHGRAEPLSALAVAVIIFVTAGVVAWHAAALILSPHQGPRWFTLPVLAAVIALKIWYSRRVGRAGSESGSTALQVEAWHHGSDALTSVAAFVGIAVAVAGGRGWESADGWAALFACLVVAFNGVGILRKVVGEMMDTAAPAALDGQIRAVAAGVAGVLALDKCRVRKSGLSYLVEIQVRVDGDIPVRQGHRIAHQVKDALLASPLQILDVSVHVEPLS